MLGVAELVSKVGSEKLDSLGAPTRTIPVCEMNTIFSV